MKKSQLTGIAGMLVIIIGTFLPYITIADQSVTLFSGGETAKTVGILFIVLACLCGICGFFGKDKTWWLSIPNLIIALLSTALILIHISKLHKEEVSGIGMAVYFIAAGSFICLISSALGIMKK